MNESKAFRLKRAADNVVRLAAEWSRAHSDWMRCDGDPGEEDLFAKQRALRIRLEGAAHELAALEAES